MKNLEVWRISKYLKALYEAHTWGESVDRSWCGEAKTWGDDWPLGANAAGAPLGLEGKSAGPGVPEVECDSSFSGSPFSTFISKGICVIIFSPPKKKSNTVNTVTTTSFQNIFSKSDQYNPKENPHTFTHTPTPTLTQFS